MKEAKIKLQDGTWADVSDVMTDTLDFVDYDFMNKIYTEEEFKAVMKCDKKLELERKLRFVHSFRY